MWYVLVLSLVAVTACGSSPVGPSPSPSPTLPTLPTVALRLVVVGHPSGLPKAGVPVVLTPPIGVTQSGTLGALTQTTDGSGAVIWQVIAGHPYSVTVRTTTLGNTVLGDVGWLSSWPD